MTDSFEADAIIELGLGNKSVELLHDNNVRTPVFSFTGDISQARLFIQALSALSEICTSTNSNQACLGIIQWLSAVHDCAEVANNFSSKIEAAIEKAADLKLESYYGGKINIGSIYKNSWYYREHLQSGELALVARLRRNILGDKSLENQIYADINILTKDGLCRHKRISTIIRAEKTLFYFSNINILSNIDVFNYLNDLETIPKYYEVCQHIEEEYNQEGIVRRLLQIRTGNPQAETQVIRRIILQMISFRLLRIHRPGLLQQDSTYLITRDFIGWLTCLVIAGVVSIDVVFQLCLDYYSKQNRKISLWSVVKNFTTQFTDACIPLISVNGNPIFLPKDLEINTFRLFHGELSIDEIPISLNCHLSVITLDNNLTNILLKTTPYLVDIIRITSAQDIWVHNPEVILEQRERDAQAYLTEEHFLVSDYAMQRNLLCSTINSYIEVDEIPLLFCHSGSESMTMFIQRSSSESIIVRKILSEALTAAKWHPNGTGVMLPPFIKAARQVDYLQALPDRIKPWFPQVYSVIERELFTSIDQEWEDKITYKEVIYEMSFVDGEEVSHFIKRNTPAPRIIARLYEIIFTFLRDNIHCENRIAVLDKTLEISYFKKIEDRLNLCQKTAPQTFCSELLDSEKIIINGYEYLNIRTLLRLFRSNPEYQNLLEPRYHSLVMGDTNTENIKLGNTTQLIKIQNMIDLQCSEEDIAEALEEINAENIQLKFLDPRAIGYQSEGDNCCDDYMYDYKPWHNSIGHYDEIHNEFFTIDMDTSAENPTITIKFIEKNEYQQAYQITDCAQKNINPLLDPTISGMEKYFAQVMNRIYDSTSSNSISLEEDPNWLLRFVFIMGTHFAAMPPFHFSSEHNGTIKDNILIQRRPVAIYCEGIKWLNWALEILQGKRDHFLGVSVQFSDHKMRGVI
uniref:Uncharacterized protein n=2 Tax=Acinetobacter larvae TaxID=1789224 RepID=A0A1J0RI43_9GAMM|nr:hypothetical protein BFG52_16545 [Acinetobacter larvae]